MDNFLKSRVEFVAEKLKIDSNEIIKSLTNCTIDKTQSKNTSDYIDHTVLKSQTTKKQVEDLCKEAMEYKFPVVCVNGSRVKDCVQILKGSSVHVASVIGFPLGEYETKDAIELGAKEIDMVINVGEFLDGDYISVFDEIKSLHQITKSKGASLKVIIETSLLETKERVCDATILTVIAGAEYVKTSTGFFGGAVKDLTKLMCDTVKESNTKVKVSGGVRTKEDALEYIQMGVHRIGTSSGTSICEKK